MKILLTLNWKQNKIYGELNNVELKRFDLKSISG